MISIDSLVVITHRLLRRLPAFSRAFSGILSRTVCIPLLIVSLLASTELRRLVAASSAGRAASRVSRFTPWGRVRSLVLFSMMDLTAGMFSVMFCSWMMLRKLSLRVVVILAGMFSCCCCTMLMKLSLRVLVRLAGIFC